MRKVLSDLLSLARSRSRPPQLDHLTRLLRRFTVERQHVPKDLRELVALNYLEDIPEPPEGQKYVIDRKKVEVLLE
jgi:hypothetical protein